MRVSHCVVLAAAIYSSPTIAFANGPQPLAVTARPISAFLIGSDQQQFGRMKFLGGLEMVSREQHFGAISGVAFAADKLWLATDTGFWMRGTLNRDASGTPIGLTNMIFDEMKGAGGARFPDKWKADAESIAVADDGSFHISFERDHRIAQYEWNNGALTFVSEEDPPVPLHELRQNRGFEGIAAAPKTFQNADAIVGITEKSLDPARNIMAFVNPPGPRNAYEFSVKRTDEYDVTDIAFLPDGDLLLLERRFNLSNGISMRLRQIEGNDIKPRATVDGPILLEADMRYQIDNMEGLAVTPIDDETVRLTLVSDDNKSLLQRNLLLEFELELD